VGQCCCHPQPCFQQTSWYASFSHEKYLTFALQSFGFLWLVVLHEECWKKTKETTFELDPKLCERRSLITMQHRVGLVVLLCSIKKRALPPASIKKLKGQIFPKVDTNILANAHAFAKDRGLRCSLCEIASFSKLRTCLVVAKMEPSESVNSRKTCIVDTLSIQCNKSSIMSRFFLSFVFCLVQPQTLEDLGCGIH
jgi:hypothetical protein